MSDLAGAWRVPAACLVLAFTLLAASGWCVLSRATSPSDGTVVNLGDQAVSSSAVTIQHDTADGLFQAGDEVVAIDGQPMRDAIANGVGGPAAHVGDVVHYELIRDGERIGVDKVLRQYPVIDAVARNWPTLLVLALILIVSAAIFTARPTDPAAQAALMSSALAFITTSGSTHFQLEAIDLVAGSQFWRWYTGEFSFMLLWAATLHMAIAFPAVYDRLRFRRNVITGYGAAVLMCGLMSLYAWEFIEDPVQKLSVLGSPVLPVLYTYPLLIVIVLIVRYRTVRNELDRNRMRWLVWSLGGGAVLYTLLFALPEAIFGRTMLPSEYHTLAFLPVPIGVAAAILRYRALNIEVVVSRSLVYGTLSAGTIGLYIGLVSLLSLVFPPLDELWQQAAAAACVAVLVQPLRSRLQSLINKRLFGDRHDPYRVVSTLAARLEETRTPSEMLPALVETIGTALRLPYAAIEIRGATGDDDQEPAATFGEPTGELFRLSLSYQGEQVGQLAVAPRSPREILGRRDRIVLAEVARHAGAAVYTARLTRDLRRSRDNVVQAREEERRRLLHDLHDGVGPTLAAISLGLHACRKAIGPVTSPGELLATLQAELDGAINEIRRVAHGLRPPELDRIGLVGAIRAYASAISARADDLGVTIALDVPISMPRLPATVDVAAYRIVSEALTNVTRHAAARSCAVRLWVDDDLHIEVVDDGIGLPEQHGTGVGLWSMRERATELGGDCVVSACSDGGTKVRATLPLPKEGG